MKVRIVILLGTLLVLTQKLTAQNRLFILSVGISDYLNPHQDPELDLKFPAKDAQDIVLIFEQFKSSHSNYYLISKCLINQQATANNILSTVTTFINHYKPTKDDILVLFISSHGWLDGLNLYLDGGRFYIRTYEFNEKQLTQTALSFKQLWYEIHRAPWQKICIIDACHSAGALPSNPYLSSNTLYLLSCQKHQKSQEDLAWNNGAFTFGLKQAITGAADLNQNQKVTFSELETYLKKEIPRLVTKAGYPQQNPIIVNRLKASNHYYFIYK